MAEVTDTGPSAGWEWHTPEGVPLSLNVGRIPGRKSVALWLSRGGEMRPVAYFRNDADAALTIVALETMAKGVLQ